VTGTFASGGYGGSGVRSDDTHTPTGEDPMILHTTSRAVRRRLVAGAVLPVLALTAACGGGEQAADSASSSESSPESASSEPYDADTIIPAMQEALGDQTSARIQMDLTGQVEMNMDGRMAMTEKFEDGEMELTLDVQGQSIDLRLVDGLIYVSGPPATPEGKWLEVDPSNTNDPMAQQFAGLTKSGSLTTTFDAFKAGLKKVEYVGEEEIDGTATDHYVLTVDGAAAAKAQDQQMPPGAGPKTLAYDVWLTQDDLMRRVAFEPGPVKAEINATEWGEPVEVEAPADADIVKGHQPPSS